MNDAPWQIAAPQHLVLCQRPAEKAFICFTQLVAHGRQGAAGPILVIGIGAACLAILRGSMELCQRLTDNAALLHSDGRGMRTRQFWEKPGWFVAKNRIRLPIDGK